MSSKKPPRREYGHIGIFEIGNALTYHNTILDGSFDCAGASIRSLVGSPIVVTGKYDCSHNNITSLKGCPREVGGDFCCHGTGIRTLKGIHKLIHRIGDCLSIPNIVESNILGILKIRDLKGIAAPVVDNEDLEESIYIVNKYLVHKPNPNTRNIHKCQEELIEAGLWMFASL